MGNHRKERPPAGGGLLLRLLVLLATLLAGACAVLAFYTARLHRADRSLDIHDLSPNQAQELLEQYREESPTVLRPAWFEPRIAYTMKPNAPLSCWGDRFTTNGLGYRTKQVAKAPNTFRVVFVGDSWTYGMGVRERDSFPAQFEVLANRSAGAGQRIEAWSLALPGYNATNELAALDAFFHLIQPDAVVCCPTNNDIDDSIGVSPQGNMVRRRRGEQGELFVYPMHNAADSHLVRSRWAETFARYEDSRERVEALGAPFFLFFVARWNEPLVHHFARNSSLRASYAILPGHLAEGKWRRPARELGHGTPEAYGAFARIVYNLVAPRLGWNPLPEPLRRQEGGAVTPFTAPPDGDWEAAMREHLRANVVPTGDFTPASPHAAQQCWSTIDWKSGAMSANPAILSLRRETGTSRLRLRLRRPETAAVLYPLDVVASIPSAGGGTRTTSRIPRDGAPAHDFTLEIPPDIEPGEALDLMIEVPRSALDGKLIAISCYVEAVVQE